MEIDLSDFEKYLRGLRRTAKIGRDKTLEIWEKKSHVALKTNTRWQHTQIRTGSEPRLLEREKGPNSEHGRVLGRLQAELIQPL